MFGKPAGKEKEQPETPQRRLADGVGVDETVLAPGTTVHGTIQGRTGVRVAGFFEGEIRIEGLLWIEQQGEVQGTVSAPGMIIEGQIKGDLDAAETIEVRSSGRVLGNIRCTKLAMAEGCFFQGEIKMSGEASRPLTFVEKRQGAPGEGKPQPGD